MSATATAPILNITLEELRLAKKMTAAAVAERMNVSRPRISQIEKEGTDSLDQLERLAEVYGVDFDIMRAVNRRTRER